MINDGLIIVDKPAGVTSHDVVASIRKTLKVKKVGHTGTLDPDATGVLILLIGKATKIARFLQNDVKGYWAEMILGIRTNTQDASGKVISRVTCDLPEKEIKRALSNFKGEISQTPPMVSAIKIDGQPLYKLAREGREIHRPSRKVNILTINFLKMDKRPYPIVTFNVTCSKGTYIRTLCSDVGDFLGCGAHLKKLVRTHCGDYCLDEAFSIEQIKELSDSAVINNHIISIQDALRSFPSIMVSEQYIGGILNGRPLTNKMVGDQLRKVKPGQLIKVVDENRYLVAISKTTSCQKDDIFAEPIRVFTR